MNLHVNKPFTPYSPVGSAENPAHGFHPPDQGFHPPDEPLPPVQTPPGLGLEIPILGPIIDAIKNSGNSLNDTITKTGSGIADSISHQIGATISSDIGQAVDANKMALRKTMIVIGFVILILIGVMGILLPDNDGSSAPVVIPA